MPEEKQENIPGDNKNFPLDDLVKKCLDAEGYVIFVGRLSNKVDEKGDRMLDFDYRRYQYSYEDTKTAIRRFKEAFINDVIKGPDD